MKQQIYSSLLLLLTAIIWGTAFVAQSVGMEYIEPFTFNGIRSMIGGAVLVPLLYWLEKPLQKKEREFPCSLENRQKKIDKTLLLGGICCGICLCAASNLQQIALQYVAVGKAGFLTACYIVIVPVLGLLFRKKCSSYLWCSVGMALIGLYFLCVKGSFSLEWADGLLLLSALLFAVHILVIDYFSPLVNGVKMACIQFFVCGLLSLLFAAILEQPQLSSILAAWLPILYAGVLSCGVGYTLQIVGQRGMNPTVASLLLSLESVASVLAGWLLLEQRLERREILGCMIIFMAIILAQLPTKIKK
ncbi:MAG: DMT family transporter [Lachnospiraceae bacterium]|nr:DMT family transporter [Lachnospiraceae bacterium]